MTFFDSQTCLTNGECLINKCWKTLSEKCRYCEFDDFFKFFLCVFVCVCVCGVCDVCLCLCVVCVMCVCVLRPNAFP